MFSIRPLRCSPIDLIQQFAVLFALSTVAIALPACENVELGDHAEDPGYELALRIAQSEGEICEPFDHSTEDDNDSELTTSDANKKGEATRCGNNSSTLTFYESPSQPIDTGESDWNEARAKCARWAMENATLLSGWNAPKCPLCPKGSKGCKVTDANTARENMQWNGSTYSCGPGVWGDFKIRYSCTKCLLDGCGDEETAASLEVGTML